MMIIAAWQQHGPGHVRQSDNEWSVIFPGLPRMLPDAALYMKTYRQIPEFLKPEAVDLIR